MLTDEERATLLKYYSTVKLDEVQKDQLAQAYWAASRAERDEIAKVYVHTFVDPTFIQRLMFFHDQLYSPTAKGGGGVGSPAGSAVAGPQAQNGTDGGSPSVGSPTSPFMAASLTANNGFSSPTSSSQHLSRRTHAQRLLCSTIQEHFPKLTGEGPYTLQFGCVQSAKVREEVIELYASQFLHPDPPELHRIVTLPNSFSTRTRKRVSGSYSWYLRCLDTQEIACAVTVMVHQQETIRFAEMPLFATGVGYKKNGFGRLLNAALVSWCAAVGLEFIMISADVQAIPFWSHVGYRLMNRGERKRMDFFYQHDCCRFKDSATMIGYCSAGADGAGGGGRWRADTGSAAATDVLHLSVSDVLTQMPRFVLDGSPYLPTN
ncbi:hypothetical protein ABL78_2305 [Leptomonas seymouri]|uniref:N-acetyltransferase domain-containing protein n=1 Tax=Leptomonas seymouri TaxID=5684 RepID=A0A0N1I9D4_LEPSE|nr:hypothetical protein ABL78_2305 [Leptomonas seymouri]|eukprot:KPI88572.1 hypothetical protein ABL78_2305 [Leptomonas seymouri]